MNIVQILQYMFPDAQALAAFPASVSTVLRCVEHGIAVPAEWLAYRRALRAIVTSTSGTPSTLPSKPNYPKGT